MTSESDSILPQLDAETRNFLERASIRPIGRDANGRYLFERVPFAQGDGTRYRFAVHPQQLQNGYAFLTICDACYYAGCADGTVRVQREIKVALGIAP